jgi:hypothetical protein
MDPIAEENEDDEFQHDDGTNFDDGDDGGPRARSNSNLTSSFVRKLYDMVENESPDVISWLPDGLAFEVEEHLSVGILFSRIFTYMLHICNENIRSRIPSAWKPKFFPSSSGIPVFSRLCDSLTSMRSR